jgi:hypothetical protein
LPAFFGVLVVFFAVDFLALFFAVFLAAMCEPSW